MLPSQIPIFPLPATVLFPRVFLPLHIFEPRYREMTAEALATDRLIGMTLLREGWESDYEGRPPIYEVGCAGLITHAEQLADGCYNIILRGFEKFRLLEEDHSRAFRIARVEGLEETPTEDDLSAVRRQRGRLEALLAPSMVRLGVDGALPSTMSDEDMVNTLAQYLDFDPLERQALLARDGLAARCESLVGLLEMKVLLAKNKWQYV